MIELINKMYQDGTLKTLIAGGLVSSKVNFYREVYLDYDKNVKTHRNASKRQAVIDTASTFRIQESTVYKIIKIMQ